MNIVFFGSSKFSLSALKACVNSPHKVCLVITTPDQKKGRGLKVYSSIVKDFCEQCGIPVETPDSLKGENIFEKVKALKPELFIAASYGKLIPKNWLSLPTFARFNVHPSLLPKYRGAAPINWPILNGDVETGVSICDITNKLDSGDIFSQKRIIIPEDITADKLEENLADMSKDMLIELLNKCEKEKPQGVKQQNENANYARKLVKSDGELDLREDAIFLERKIRGLKPWPHAFLRFQGEYLLILSAKACNIEHKKPVATLLEISKDGHVLIAAGNGALKILEVKPAGKKSMPAADFIRGRRFKVGDIIKTS